MTSENNTETEMKAPSSHPIFQVTTVSKYLALLLFIALPFLGAWVGYTYAPVQIIPIINGDTTTKEPETNGLFLVPEGFEEEDIETAFRELSGFEDYTIEGIYREAEGPLAFYVATHATSAACCTIVAFNIESGIFFETPFIINPQIGETISLDGRFLARVLDPTEDTATIQIIDLETQTIVTTITPQEGEMLRQAQCGDAVATYDLTFSEENVLSYGVYADDLKAHVKCDNTLIEMREERAAVR